MRDNDAHLKVRLQDSDLEGFDCLAELTLDMCSAWNHGADEVWRRLDAELWDMTRNTWVVLRPLPARQIVPSTGCLR